MGRINTVPVNLKVILCYDIKNDVSCFGDALEMFSGTKRFGAESFYGRFSNWLADPLRRAVYAHFYCDDGEIELLAGVGHRKVSTILIPGHENNHLVKEFCLELGDLVASSLGGDLV